MEIQKSHFSSMAKEVMGMERGRSYITRPIYSLHSWWGRRSGMLIRLIVLYVFREKIERKNLDLVKLKLDLSLFPNNEPTDQLPLDQYMVLKTAFTSPHSFSDSYILDPFMGGGSTIIESLRLGCKTIGYDINPLAWLITKVSSEMVDLAQLEFVFHSLMQVIKDEIEQYYQTACPKCTREIPAIHYIWSFSTQCSSCEKRVFLLKSSTLLSSKAEALYVCPFCADIVHQKRKGKTRKKPQKTLNCSNGHEFQSSSSTWGRGKIKCLSCGSDSIDVTPPFVRQLIAIKYECESCGDRGYKPPDTADFSLLQNITDLTSGQRIYPPALDKDIRWIQAFSPIRKFGFQKYADIFNERQLLCLSKLRDAISHIEDGALQDLMLLTFSNTLSYNNMLCHLNRATGSVSGIFSFHQYRFALNPVELNVWGYRKGAGSFSNIYKKRIVKAKQYNRTPFERDKTGVKYIQGEIINNNLGTDFNDLVVGAANCLLLCKSSTNMQEIPEKSIDLIIFDPPFFGNIDYKALTEFHYVWFEDVLSQRYGEVFAGAKDGEELFVSKREGRSEFLYVAQLKGVLSEVARVLNERGVCVSFVPIASDSSMVFSYLDALISGDLAIDEIHLLEMTKQGWGEALVFLKKINQKEDIDWNDFQIDLNELQEKILKCKKEEIAQRQEIILNQIKKLSYVQIVKNGKPLPVDNVLRALERYLLI